MNITTERLFKKGEEVEVSTGEEGFEDSWFLATIIGKSRSRNKYRIEYKTLLNKNETNPLKEYVHVSMLRPIPPQETISTTRDFQLDEVVDAYLNEGWWKGVVNKIIRKGLRYSVFFPATKEVLRFDQADLRGHLDWVDGKWILQNGEVLYEETSGAPENFGGFLSPTLTGSSVCSMDMDMSQTPCAVRRNLWEAGVTISKNMQEKMDQSLTQIIDSPSDLIVSSQKHIEHSAPRTEAESERPFKKLRSGQTAETLPLMKGCSAKETSIESPQSLLSSATKRNRRKRSSPQRLSNVIEGECAEVIGLPKVLIKGPLCGTETTLQGARALDKQTKVLTKKTGESPGSGFQTECTPLPNDNPEEFCEEDYQPLSTFLQISSSSVVKATEGVVDKVVVDVFEKRLESSGKASVIVGLENEVCRNEVTYVQAEDTPLPSVIAEEHQPLSMFHDKSSSNVNFEGMVDKQVVNVLKRRTKQVKRSSKEASVIGCEHQEVSEEMPVVLRDTQLLTITAEEHQPLSPCLQMTNSPVENNGGGLCPDHQHLHNEAINRMDASMESPVLQVSSNVAKSSFLQVCTTVQDQQVERTLPSLGGSWPFIKSSHLWATFESNQLFKLMPQRPHFQPLEQYNEETREGQAIGMVLNFCNLVDRTLKANLKEPRSVFENRLKFLADLEKHGFDVHPMRIRLKDILERKSSYCELDDQKKVAEREIGEQKRKLDEIDLKLQALLKEKEKESSSLAERKREMAGIDELLQGVELGFNKMVTSPLVM